MNESTIFVEGQMSRALIDSGSQMSFFSVIWVKKLRLNLQQLHSVLKTEGYLGYVETHLKMPECYVMQAVLMSQLSRG